MRVTADTNIFVSAAIARGNEYRLLELAAEGSIQLVLSPDIIAEFREVLSRKKFGFSQQQIEEAVKHVLTLCELIIPSERVSVVRDDPDDDRILECALAGHVAFLASGDKHLLELQSFRGIQICGAKQVVAECDKER